MQRHLKLFSISQKIWNGKYFYSSNIQPVSLSFTLYGSTTKMSNTEAPPIIVMHGLLGSKNNWRSFCRNLQENVITNRRIFVVDARNHGESPHTDEHSYLHMAEDIVHFLKQQNIQNAAIMGHSMGGKAMMAVALKYPEFVERAIFIDISPKNLPRSFSITENIFDVMQSIQIPSSCGMTKARNLVEKQLQTVIDPVTASFITQNFKKLDSGEYAWITNVTALQKNYKKVADFPSELDNLQFNKPVLFIGGMKSEFIRKEDWPNIQKIFPNSKLCWVNAGHLVHMEQPVETTNLISEFLSQN